MLKLAKRILKDNRGQGMAEYGLILALIAIVCIGALVALGPEIADKFTEVKDALGSGSSMGG